jgi:hypothetical protein
MEHSGVGAEMPRYRCHKEVWALKIKEVRREQMPKFERATCRGSYMLGTACGHCERCKWEREHGPAMGAMIVPEEPGYAPFPVDAAYLIKHSPVAGGYYVVYPDGYKSFSPAKAFEEGYTRI